MQKLKGKRVMLQDEILLTVNLGDRGECQEEIWTTDLSHEYIRINAEYRTKTHASRFKLYIAKLA